MHHCCLGKTGLQLPRVTFGTGPLGNLYGAPPFETKLEIVRQWFRHDDPPVAVDTAGKYGAGLSLESIGRALAELDVAPDAIVLSNKLGWRRVPLTGPEPTFEPGVWEDLEFDAEQDLGYDGVLRCFEQGCELLGPRYTPQLVSVHDPDEYLAAAASDTERQDRLGDVLAAYRALFDLRAEGRVAGVGVGAKDWRVIAELDRAVELDWVMFANSMTLFDHPHELWEFMQSLADRDIGVINSALFHGGFLVGGEFFDYRRVDPAVRKDRELLDWRERLCAECARFDVSPAHACVQFGLAAPGVASVAIATSRPERIGAMVEMAREPLAPEFWGALRGAGLIQRDVAVAD